MKTYWNYRIIKTPDQKVDGFEQSYTYRIHEVHYENGKPTSWSENPMYPSGESFNDLYKDHSCMHEAFTQKILVIEDDKLVERSRFK